ncbi:sensor histidine kinase [Desulfoplanes formicivorans]|uniref:histidine kinase n=1 Tax=Desulfoplanes formicivorans TaxID=1592317 RepID=A0A194AJK8_9BACT|nr:ATP-binding protein [Desulfoplanes formicivorans]GAU09241.1 histidine kinase [Desulfoplanes formicivorans]
MGERYYTTLRKQILTGMILVPVIPFLLIIGVGYYHFSTSIKENTIASMERIVRDHRDMVASFLRERRADLAFVLAEHGFQELQNPEILSTVFTHLQKESPTFVDLGIFDPQGVLVAYVGPYKLSGKVYKETTWFREVMNKGFFQSDVFLGFRNIPHFVIALSGNHEQQPWVIRATIDTYRFSEIVESIRIGRTGEAYIVNKSGIFQTQRRSGGRFLEHAGEQLHYPDRPNGIRTYVQKDHRDMTFLYATTWIIPHKWLLVVRQDKNDAFAALNKAAWMSLVIAVVSGMGMIFLAIVLSKRIEKRLRITDKEKASLQDQLIRATRLAELGEMAAGFAHEINNPLQVMESDHAYIALILEDMKQKGDFREGEDSQELEQALGQIKKQIRRCARITQSILRFGRQGKPEYKKIDLTTFMPEVVSMIAKKASVNGIELTSTLPEQPLTIHADPGHMQQVLLNLFNNAIYAIVERHGSEGGRLGITGTRTDEGLVEIRVQDNGGGISPENQKKIFSPFFTTKPVGKGTGLGLSVCFGLVENMGGTMEVSSQQGTGTTFTLRFPSR